MRLNWPKTFSLLCCSFLFLTMGFLGCGNGTDGGAEKKPTKDPQKVAWEKSLAQYPAKISLGKYRNKGLFNFSRSRILAMLVKKLDGASGKDSFDHIRGMFARIPAEEAVPLLTEEINQLISADFSTRGILQNTCEAAGYVRDHRLVEPLMKAAMVKAAVGSQVSYNPAVVKAAMGAIGACGKPEQCDDLWEWFMGRKKGMKLAFFPQANLFRALVKIEGDSVAPRIKDILGEYQLRRHLQGEMLDQIKELSPKKLLPSLLPFFLEFQGTEKVLVAGILHQAGNIQGTAYLKTEIENAKKRNDAQLLGALVLQLGKGPGARWTQEVMPYSTHAAPAVRVAVIQSLQGKPGEDVKGTLEYLAQDLHDSVRRQALIALKETGYMAELTLKLETVKTATGTVMNNALQDLLAVNDKRLAQVATQRLPKSSGPEKFSWMRVLGTFPSPEGVDALMQVFREERKALARKIDNVYYASQMLANIPLAIGPLQKAFHGEFKQDLHRRYLTMIALTRIACLPKLKDQERHGIIDFLMAVVKDETADPRDRIIIPRKIRNLIGMDEVGGLKKVLRTTKNKYVQTAINDFLWEFFGR